MINTIIDNFIIQADQGLRTLCNSVVSTRENPAASLPDSHLSRQEKKDIAGMMRVNHAGEIAAQALYQGQAITARDGSTQSNMQQSADEEVDHLAWCQQRLQELGSHTSYLAPFWYVGALGIGALAGLAGDKWSLGFVAETEHQVMRHLQSHLDRIPPHDVKSRRIIEQMHHDESQHAAKAMEAGAATLPPPIKQLMKVSAKVMTTTAYWV